jgi:hypothetical protein
MISRMFCSWPTSEDVKSAFAQDALGLFAKATSRWESHHDGQTILQHYQVLVNEVVERQLAIAGGKFFSQMDESAGDDSAGGREEDPSVGGAGSS